MCEALETGRDLVHFVNVNSVVSKEKMFKRQAGVRSCIAWMLC